MRWIAQSARLKKKLLLINPRSPESFWSFRWAVESILPGKRALNAPLGLATVAALSPADWDVVIVDENIESVPLAPAADVVGVCGMGVQWPRQKELITYYRAQGYYTVAGGSYASLCPEKYDSVADTVVAGEAERTWPEFCADFEAGAPRRLYRETAEIDLAESPLPRFDLLQLHRYAMVSVQFSRGCPFRCEFCDIIVMFGRKPRTKSIAQIGRELEALRALGVQNVFVVDDNFIGNKPQAKELLRYLRDEGRRHGTPFRLGTEASLNLAQDPELLELFRAANFQWVFIGIESPDEESLREAGKVQNTREDMLVSIRRIYAHGIDVFAGFIVGFDHDTLETFDRQYAFIMRSGIQVAMVGMLTAMPRTPLYGRLEAAGRLLPEGEAHSDNTSLGTNVVPMGMTVEAMVGAYKRLYQRLSSDRAIADRIRAKFRHLRPPARPTAYSPRASVGIALRLLRRGVRSGGVTRWLHFTRTVLFADVRAIPLVMGDWIAGLSIRDYAARHLTEPAVQAGLVARLRRRLEGYVRSGSLELSFEQVRNSCSLKLRGGVDRPFFRRAARELRRVLRKGRTSVTLIIEDLDRRHARNFQRLLRRLGRYADRVSVSMAGTLRDIVEIDSSRFHVLLA